MYTCILSICISVDLNIYILYSYLSTYLNEKYKDISIVLKHKLHYEISQIENQHSLIRLE